MPIRRCGLCGTFHDSMRAAMACCDDEFGDLDEDDDDGGAAAVALPDGGRDHPDAASGGPEPDPRTDHEVCRDGSHDIRTDHRAEGAWVEVREDGIPVLCLDTNRGRTETVELSRVAARELRQEFIHGPSVRHDQPDDEPSARCDGGRRPPATCARCGTEFPPETACPRPGGHEFVSFDGGCDTTDSVYLRVDGLAPGDADGTLRTAANRAFETLHEIHGDDVDGVVPVLDERYDPRLGARDRALDVFEDGEHVPDTVREQLAELGVELDDLTPLQAGVRGGLWRSDVPALVATILDRVEGQVEIFIQPAADGHHWRVEWDCFDVDGDADGDEAADEVVTDGGERTIQACPECDCSKIYERKTTEDYRCIGCGAEFDEPTVRGSKGGRPPKPAGSWYRCYQCGERFRSQSGKPQFTAPCGHTLVAWRARIAYFADNKAIQKLAERPRTLDDIGLSSTVRKFTCKLKAPRQSPSATTHPGGRSTNGIAYLPGDERAAMRAFIDANREFVASCFDQPANIIAQSWSDEEYKLLVEQWEWTHVDDDAENDASADGAVTDGGRLRRDS